MKKFTSKITSHLFEAYLHCPTKCFLYASETPPSGNVYADWLTARQESYRNQTPRGITEALPPPVRFTFANKLSRMDKLLLAFDALALPDAVTGRIIHSDEYKVSKVKLTPLMADVRKTANKITLLLSQPDPPRLALNRHCPECEFQKRCHTLAMEKDDLSLLGGLSATERTKLNNKGIFSVTQLSYTFRPRRPSRRIAARPEKYHHALKALAIREQKTHIAGRPPFAIDGTPVFLDVEGVPDRSAYYLIGVRAQGRQYSLWADNAMEEASIWRDFLALLSRIERPVLVHYGSFETIFLKKMRERHGALPEDSPGAKAIASSVNLLAVIFAHIYFPTYSNGLKEIAQHLGFTWRDPGASGLRSLIWRHQWEASHDPALQEKLIVYNADDCEALSLITETIHHYVHGEPGMDIVHADSLKRHPAAKLGAFKSAVAGLEQINRAARWDYQRDRIYTRPHAKAEAKPKRRQRKASSRVEKTMLWKAPAACPACGAAERKKSKLVSRTVHDLIYGHNSLKRQVVRYLFQTYRCQGCGLIYGLDRRFGHANRKYGWEVLAYCIYHVIGLAVSQSTVTRSLNKILGFDLERSNLQFMKVRAANYYRETRDAILRRILSGDLIHADETRANIKGRHAYVWVLTNMREVVYLLAETREAEPIRQLLSDFKGVLVSDFYAAYDAIVCPQQKCLIHIIRDLNDEMFRHPFDEDLKRLTTLFSGLLQPIIATIDMHGLKTQHLQQYLSDVDRFYEAVEHSGFQSDIVLKYVQRLVKNRDKLFTFLRYDDVPWNNNNAEHAIKSFALLRNIISGPSTKKGTEDYLTLLSVCRTCEYQGVDFLDFLRSGEKDIAAFANMIASSGT